MIVILSFNPLSFGYNNDNDSSYSFQFDTNDYQGTQRTFVMCWSRFVALLLVLLRGSRNVLVVSWLRGWIWFLSLRFLHTRPGFLRQIDLSHSAGFYVTKQSLIMKSVWPGLRKRTICLPHSWYISQNIYVYIFCLLKLNSREIISLFFAEWKTIKS